jgi:hypothetical protein
MTIRSLYGMVALGLLALPAAAQSPAGTWKAMVEGPQGAFPLIFSFEVDGEKLTGTVTNHFLPVIPISEGTASRDAISFQLKLQAVTLRYSGVLRGDELTLTAHVIEERPSAGQTLGGILRWVDGFTATRGP